MEFAFLFNGPHHTHAAWAESVNSTFIPNKIGKYSVPNISRFLKSVHTAKKISKNVDVLICEGGSDLVAGARWKGRNSEKKLVLIVDDPKMYYFHTMNTVKRRLYSASLDRVDLFIPTTPLMKSLIPGKYRPKAKIAELFVDHKRYFSENTDLDNNNIVFVGLLCKEKGIDRIIKAFNNLRSDFPNSNLYLVGDGPMKGKSKNNINFVGWDENPKKYIVKGSVYINLARIEPAGVAVLEGMSSGLVPIVTRGVGFCYAVEDVSKNLVVNNHDEASDIIRKLWNDKKTLRAYSNRSKIVSGKFTKKRSVKMFKSALHEML